MNPFLESTVATPQTDARWRQPSGRDCAQSAGSLSGRGRAGSPPQAKPFPGGTPLPNRRLPGWRRLGGTLRAMLLTGSLLVPCAVQAVDINTATLQQLQEIKGIGPKTAGLIIEERDRGGRFESMDDVSERVKGIGPKKAASLQAAGLTVGSAAGAPAKEGEAAVRSPRRGR